jgi:hypothetical protein
VRYFQHAIIYNQYLQGLGTFDCKTALCIRYILANSSIDRRAQPQVAVERFAVLDFRRTPVTPGNRMRQDPVDHYLALGMEMWAIFIAHVVLHVWSGDGVI